MNKKNKNTYGTIIVLAISVLLSILFDPVEKQKKEDKPAKERTEKVDNKDKESHVYSPTAFYHIKS